MADQLRPTVRRLVEKLADESGVRQPRLTVTEAAQNGESFSGSVYRVLVHETADPSGCEFQTSPAPILRFICKLPPTQAHRRAAFSSARHFAREQFVLGHLLPDFAEFQTAASAAAASPIPPFDNHPRMLAASDADLDEFVLLADLQADGYATAVRNVPLAYERVTLVLQRLAQLHAISFAYRQQRPTAFATLAGRLSEIMFVRPVRQEMRDVMEPNVQFAVDALLEVGGADAVRLAEKMRVFRKGFSEAMVHCSEAAASTPAEAVVLHGDCWISNLMFRAASVDGDEADVKIVDWQVSRYGSVAIDLSYFLFCCTDGETRARMPELLAGYHAALVRRIAELGSDGAALFPAERLQWHMREYARFGVGMAIMTLHAITCPAADMVNVGDCLDAGTDLQAVGARMALNPVYRRRMAAVCRDADRLGYL